MKLFQVVVNGNSYKIQVEEITEETVPEEKSVHDPKPASGPQLAVVSSDRRDAKAKNGGKGEVKAPMPGVIGAIMKSPGDSVKAGEAIMLLEAMKLENDVTAPKDGVISKIHVSEGQSVSTGDVLAEVQ